MLALLRGGGRADIIMPTQSSVNRYYEDDLAQPLDLDAIKNYANVSEFFKGQPWSKWNGNQMGYGDLYVIPYVFGTHGLVFNTSKYTKSLNDIGWEVLVDKELKGRVSAKDNLPSLWPLLDLLGIPLENLSTDPKGTLEKIRPKAIELKNNVLKFYGTEAEFFDLMKNEEVWVSKCEDGDARKLAQFDAKFKYVIPKTGGLGWCDTFMIPKEAANPSGANLFIDFMLRPDIAAILTQQSGYTTTIESALDETNGIDKDLYRFTDEQLEKLKFIPNLSQESRSLYQLFWDELSTLQ
jgi:spermidine/putrescine transport system substrate-binding protein